MNGIEQLHPKNHTLYLRVQHLVRLKWSWEAIADDAGLVGDRRVQDLCDWVLAYREPKTKPMVKTLPPTDRLPIGSPSSDRFLAWRKQRDGARQALEALGQ